MKKGSVFFALVFLVMTVSGTEVKTVDDVDFAKFSTQLRKSLIDKLNTQNPLSLDYNSFIGLVNARLAEKAYPLSVDNEKDKMVLFVFIYNFLDGAFVKEGITEKEFATAAQKVMPKKDISWADILDEIKTIIDSRNIEGAKRWFSVTPSPDSWQKTLIDGTYEIKEWKSLYVRATGNDDNLGLSEAEPLRTLGKALQRATRGSIKNIIVIGTLYAKDEAAFFYNTENEFYIWDTGSAQIFITGKPNATKSEKAVLDGTGRESYHPNVITLNSNTNIRFENIEITGGSRGIYVNASATTSKIPILYLGQGTKIHGNGQIITAPTGYQYLPNGAGVYIGSEGGKVILCGADIYENTAEYGGGVYVSKATNLLGKTIDEAGFILESGSISNNSADYGGGVYSKGSFTMRGGSITENKAKFTGGGLYHTKESVASQSGGDIDNNTANEDGKDIYEDER